MRTIEKIGIVLAIMGEGMLMFSQPEGWMFLLLGLGTLCFLYVFFSWLLFRERETKANNISLSIVAGFACALAVSGMLFKLLYWPGSRFLLFAGFVSIATLVIPYYIYMNQSRDQQDGKYNYYLAMLLRLMITASIASLLLLIPSRTLLHLQYRDDPQRGKIIEEMLLNPGEERLMDRIRQYRDTLDTP